MALDEKGRVCLDAGETVVFHVREWKMERVNVAPRGARQRIFQNALVLKLDEVDGEPGEYEYRVTSERLARSISPLLDSGAYADRSVTLHVEGQGRLRSLEFHTAPRGARDAPPLREPLPAWGEAWIRPGVVRDRQGRARNLAGRYVVDDVTAREGG